MKILTEFISDVLLILFILGVILLLYGLIKSAIDFDPNGPVLERMTEEEIEAWKKKKEKRKNRIF